MADNTAGSGVHIYEFGPDPGSFKIWFGRFLGKQFKDIPEANREWLVDHSKQKKSPNLLKFKRLAEEYRMWENTQPEIHTTKPDAVANLSNNSWQQQPIPQRKRRKTDVELSNNLVTTANPSGALQPSTSKVNQRPRRQGTNALKKTTKPESKSYIMQKIPQLKQTTLSFARTPLGNMLTHTTTPMTCGLPVAPIQGSLPSSSGKIGGTLLTTKGDSPRGKPPAKELPVHQLPPQPRNIPNEKSKPVLKESQPYTPPPMKRRKTTHNPEPVSEDIRSSQSSVHSDWRPLDLGKLPLNLPRDYPHS